MEQYCEAKHEKQSGQRTVKYPVVFGRWVELAWAHYSYSKTEESYKLVTPGVDNFKRELRLVVQ